jgi:cytochrome P450
MQLTLRTVSRALFGHDVSAGQVEVVGRAMRLFQDGLVRTDLLPAWVPSPQRSRLREALAALDAMTYEVIARRRAPGARPARAGGAPDLLQMLVDAVDEEGDGGRMTEKELRDQLVTLFLAGHETTSHALSWALYCLSQNPAAEQALHEEVDAVLGAEGRDPTYEDLERMPWGEQVISEAMRLYPPVYSIARAAHEDTEIGGYPVRAGSEVMLWVYMTHHDPRFFPEPEAFRPERFTAEEEAKRPRLAYLPFGAGPRACIGKVFAMIEARLLLATIVRRWRLELAPGHRVAPRTRITLVPSHGMRMRIVRRGRRA